MFFVKSSKVRSFEVGLLFRDGEFRGLLGEGTHRVFDPLGKVAVEVVSRRVPQLLHEKLDLIVASGVLKGMATVLDLKDDQRGLVWVDGRFFGVCAPGLHVLWNGPRALRVEVVDARRPRLEHDELQTITRWSAASTLLDVCDVNRGCAGVLFLDGRYADTLAPGRYAFWKGVADARVVEVDLREASLDVGGQEIMTADRVTLRLNVVVTYRVVDARRAVCASEDARQGLYREAQLALRAVVGGRTLDALLADKEALAAELVDLLRGRAAELGLEVVAAGIRDVILPGEMKELLNKVMEARTAAEANLVTRREETAALRSQANTARLLAENPTLMRLRELEVLEKVACGGELKIVLGEKGLADRLVNLL
ncbi:MAG TPA: slipin family protein [Isosphaeraceae bacterium]|jgi:regulator of protease activity HflC (stomatin/prohibitin superfamily)|nr:slipin family protein [Isosphaeraceae bacterium]